MNWHGFWVTLGIFSVLAVIGCVAVLCTDSNDDEVYTVGGWVAFVSAALCFAFGALMS